MRAFGPMLCPQRILPVRKQSKRSSAMKRVLFLLGTLVLSISLSAQDRPPTSPGVGSAVLLATHSIQIDRDSTIVSGDVIVNGTASAPFLGELALSLDRGVTTPAGYKLAATSVDLDQTAVA